MKEFHSSLGLHLGFMIMGHVENMFRSLQGRETVSFPGTNDCTLSRKAGHSKM